MDTPSKSPQAPDSASALLLDPPSELSHGAAAGFLFQLERALFWLAESDDPDAEVGVETWGDVFQCVPNSPGIHEEDKHSVQSSGHPLGDHDVRLWRTLEIWCDATQDGSNPQRQARLLLVTNRPIGKPTRRIRIRRGGEAGKRPSRLLCQQLAAADSADDVRRCVERMREMAEAIPDSLSSLYERVMAYDDEILASVVHRFELWEGSANAGPELRRKIVGRLHVPPDVDGDHVVQALAGWLHEVLLKSWRNREPGWVSRRSFDAQLDRIRQDLKRDRVLARSATRLPLIGEAEKASAKQRRFVAHLAQIGVDDEELDLAIEDYLRYGTEHLRLLQAGVISNRCWDDRAEHLRDRWRRISNRLCRRRDGINPALLGRDILDDTLDPGYTAPLAGESQPELYFTHGHYHRIADEDQVWWYPCDQPDY